MRQVDCEFKVSLVVGPQDRFQASQAIQETLFKKERKITIAKHVFKKCLGLDRATGLGYCSVVKCLRST